MVAKTVWRIPWTRASHDASDGGVVVDGAHSGPRGGVVSDCGQRQPDPMACDAHMLGDGTLTQPLTM